MLSLFALLYVFVSMCEVASAHGRDGWWWWKPTKRSLIVSVNKRSLKIYAQYKNHTYEDEFEFAVDLGKDYKDEIVEMEFDYQSKSIKNRTSLSLDFSVNRLVEFLSPTSQPEYRGNQKDVVSDWPTKGGRTLWNNWVDNSKHGYLSAIANDGGDGKVYSFSATSVDGVFGISVSIASTPIHLPGLAVDPNSVKIDFEIKDYPYKGKPNDTRLALATELKSGTDCRSRHGRSIWDNKVIFSDDPDLPFGAFSWVPTVNIVNASNSSFSNATNSSYPIVAYSPQANSTRARRFDIYFTFLTPANNSHPDHLVWDPRLGLDYEEEPDPEPFCMGSLCGAGAIGVAAMLVAVVVVIPVIALLVRAYLRKHQHQYQELE